MEKKVIKLEGQQKSISRPKKKVAAYARVSVESTRLDHSLLAQTGYYRKLIESNPEWELAGIYADHGISGTQISKRLGFQDMVADAEKGLIDIILTKSIQRFARNTVDLLKTVRHLRNLGVEVRFEKENINTMSGDGELMLSILASFAQEESRSISQNIKWSVQKKFEQGLPFNRVRMLGYSWKDDELTVIPKEAALVQLIYRKYLEGYGFKQLAQYLNEIGYRTIHENLWRDCSVRHILTNRVYTGDWILQKRYSSDPILKKEKRNLGEKQMYLVEEDHEAIIDYETFQAVQEEIEKRSAHRSFRNDQTNITCFSWKIFCGKCGHTFQRRINGKNRNGYTYGWKCSRLSHTEKNQEAVSDHACSFPETMLKKICAYALGTEDFHEDLFIQKICQITVFDDHFEFWFMDGSTQQIETTPFESAAQKRNKANREIISQKPKAAWRERQCPEK